MILQGAKQKLVVIWFFLSRFYRTFWIALSLVFYLVAHAFFILSEYIKLRAVYARNSSASFRQELWSIRENLRLFREIRLSRPYFAGLPYQALQLPKLFGDREIETRLREYQIWGYFDEKTNVIDLGSAEGFLGIKISELTGARVTCVDHDHSALQRGFRLAQALKVNSVSFICEDISEFQSDTQFDVVLAMAAYKTDDGGLDFELREYFNFLTSLLTKHGVCIFESHFHDGNLEDILKEISQNFNLEIIKMYRTDNDNRVFAVLKKG